jgi:hypothetical protein
MGADVGEMPTGAAGTLSGPTDGGVGVGAGTRSGAAVIVTDGTGWMGAPASMVKFTSDEPQIKVLS